ncbi:MAG: sulfotransferase family 2 domain-containing protein [Acidimicrobiales bacterium]|nr:sulfotransferase family 2 domain-containing protein [Acidimicrobiales bacterium]
MKNPRIYFLHLTKCGGTSVKAALRKSVPLGEHGQVFDLEGDAATRTAERFDVPNWRFRDQQLHYCLQTNHVRLVMGHFRYTDDFHGEFHDRWKMITVLREPEERLLSLYFYNRFKDNDYGKVTEELEAFLFEPDGSATRRSQVHAAFFVAAFRGTGQGMHHVPTQADVDLATRNLERFAAVGILEDMEPFKASIESITGTPFDLPVLNTSPARASDREVVDERVRERVIEICRPARVLYERFGGQPL